MRWGSPAAPARDTAAPRGSVPAAVAPTPPGAATPRPSTTAPAPTAAARQPTAATATKCGYEDHEGATRGKYTYEVIGTPPVPATHPSPQFLEILRKWAWLTPSA